MCTLNNHQLWLGNIYDHELMMLSMVPTHELRGKGSLFLLRKMANITNKRFPIFNKMNFF